MAKETPLVLGWKVNNSNAPEYWLPRGPRPRPGDQDDEHLVRVPGAKMGTHTVIIGQSGSGKSMFLGRLIEELLLRTRARCLILDPNSDFKKIDIAEKVALWNKAEFDTATGRGKLPHEYKKTDFTQQWDTVGKKILVSRRPAEDLESPKEELRLWWPDLSVELLAGDLGAMQRSEVYHCHAYSKAVANLRHWLGGPLETARIIKTAGVLLDDARAVATGANRRKLIMDIFQKGLKLPRLIAINPLLRYRVLRLVDLAIIALKYVQEPAASIYFGRAEELLSEGLLSSKAPSEEREELQVVDIPSIRNKDHQLLAVGAILETEWNLARLAWAAELERKKKKKEKEEEEEEEEEKEEDKRVPTFIVLDEAHNLLPRDPRDQSAIALRDQFRTYAAEGRKFGIFLILATQRPDKLDAQVLSECGNKAIMHLDSEFILDLTRERLGLEDIPPRLLQRTLDFGGGRALLVGNWAPDGPEILYCAARRTVEGGRNLREEHWANRPERKPPLKPRRKPAKKKTP